MQCRPYGTMIAVTAGLLSSGIQLPASFGLDPPVSPQVRSRGVHGNGTDSDPMGPMGFPWEWELLWLYHGNGNGNKSMGMGIKQWEWEWIPIVSVLHKIHIIIMHACECSAVLANKSMLPKLYAVARKVLCVPASSSASERVFSTAGRLLEKRRTSLAPSSVNSLLFLHSSMQWELKLILMFDWLTANTEQIFWLNYESWHSIILV